MKGKLLFVAGAAVGYILGARAGRKRYEQIKSAAQKVWDQPAVQKQVHQAQEFAADKVGDIPSLVGDGVKKLVHAATAPSDKPGKSGRSGVSKSTTVTVASDQSPTAAAEAAANGAAQKTPGSAESKPADGE
jgi:hypothetical protein